MYQGLLGLAGAARRTDWLFCLTVRTGEGTRARNIKANVYRPAEAVDKQQILFTNSAPLGRVGHRVAMSVVVWLCGCVGLWFRAIAKHPLPEVV